MLGPTIAPENGALSLVGRAAPNRAITALAVDDGWPLPEITVRLEVRAFGGATPPGDLVVEGGVEVGAQVREETGPGAFAVTIPLRRTTGGRVTIRLAERGDALARDDSVALSVPPPPAPDIALLKESDDSSLWIQLAADALAEISGGRVVRGDGVEKAGFLLAEGGAMALPEGRALTFGTALGGRPATRADLIEQPVVVDWDRAHDLTRGLDFSELRISSCLRPDLLPPGARTLVSGEAGPLVVAVEDGVRRSVHTAFRLADSNLPTLAACPQLLRRTYVWAYGAAATAWIDPANLLSAAESELARAAPSETSRSLPTFGTEGFGLAVPLLCLGFLALLLRLYV